MVDSNPSQQTKQGQDTSRTLRVIVMLGALLISVLLWIAHFPPVFVALFLSILVSTFFYEVLGAVDPQNTMTLDVGFGGAKVSGKFLGSIAVFLIIWGAGYYALDKDEGKRDRELIIRKVPSDSQYIYLLPKAPASALEAIQAIASIGKLDFANEFELLKKADLFNPHLIKIRNDCAQKLGICALPDQSFPIKVLAFDAKLPADSATICSEHAYLEQETLLISLKNLGLDQWTEDSGIAKIKVIDLADCKSSDYKYPRIKISKQLSGSGKMKIGASYAYITGE